MSKQFNKNLSPCVAQGLTLIEILVVVLIISIITGVAVLSISRNQNQKIEAFANALSQSISLAQERAILQQDTLGVSLSQQIIEFDWYSKDPEGKVPDWQPLDEGALVAYKVPRGLSMILEVGGKSASVPAHSNELKPQILISSSGDLTPFILYIGETERSPSYKLVGAEDGSLHVTKL